MHNKQPVTPRERGLYDEGVLVSHSDLKGHITCAAPALVSIGPPELTAMGS